MKFNELTSMATRAIHKAGFQLKKHSPEILVVTGIVGTVASTVLACKATTKLHAVLDDTKEKIDMFHQGAEDGQVKSVVDGEIVVVNYTEEDCTRDISLTYAKTGVEIAKLYGPAVVVGAASIASILVGYNILHKRTLAYAAAYTAADTTLKEYRGRVIERFGEKLDKELLYNIKTKEIEETVVNEDGSETTVKKTVEVAESVPAQGFYSFCFDETADGWVRDAERNKYFLKVQQDYANELLRARGYVFLNEVLDMLGIQRTPAGQSVGWVLNSEKGDGYIDFGVFDIRCEANRRFVNCLEKSVWLNFNVDGDIRYSLKPKKA